jgi:hypothetical protein
MHGATENYPKVIHKLLGSDSHTDQRQMCVTTPVLRAKRLKKI